MIYLPCSEGHSETRFEVVKDYLLSAFTYPLQFIQIILKL